MSRLSKPLISIVTPCYNEELNVERHLAAVLKAVEPLRQKYQFEHIYTDNASSDRTFEVLSSLAGKNPMVRVLRFSRNIGSTRAMMMGLSRARGEATMLIQADLQDPPELIPDFIRGWEDGHDVVYGLILNREKEGRLLQALRRTYYAIVDRLSEVPIPRNAGDFRLTSRRALESILQYSEYDTYLRGVVAHVGFPQKAIPYTRRPREEGESQAPFFYLIGFALNGIVSTTLAPLRLITIIGSIVSIVSFALAAYLMLFKLAFPQLVPQGITTVAVLVTFFAGMQLLAMGIIGEYIRKIYVEVSGRPRGFIRDELNFDKAQIMVNDAAAVGLDGAAANILIASAKTFVAEER